MLRHLLTQGDAEMNNNINGVALTTPMDAFHWGQFPTNSSVAGTSELFSSTFAMLSGESAAPFQEQWHDQKPQVLPGSLFFDQSAAGPIVPGLYDPGLDNNPLARFDAPVLPYRSMYDSPSTAPFLLPPYPSQFLQQPQTSIVQPTPTHPIHIKQDFADTSFVSPLARPSPPHTQNLNQRESHSRTSITRHPSSVSPSLAPAMSPLALSESADGSPMEAISTDLEGPDGVRVMCLACKGVYPSRRSLTGHIGRNEKCREIIGRNYLDQVAAGCNPVAPGTESALKAGALTNGTDGLSPVCPFCDRFISHYKGNIRRHINQCGKNNTGQRRPRSDKEKERKRNRKRLDEGPPPILHEGFEPVSPMLMNQPMTSFLPLMTDDCHQREQNSNQQSVHLPSDPSPTNPKKETEPPEDAYICGQCEFVTIYKGNMKRHLNTCHPAPDCKDLKEWDRKLESMRASALGISRVEMLDRLQQHKNNSTRGRKPRAKREERNGDIHMMTQQQQQQQQQQVQQVQQHVQQPLHLQTMMMSPHDFSNQIHYNNYDMSGYL